MSPRKLPVGTVLFLILMVVIHVEQWTGYIDTYNYGLEHENVTFHALLAHFMLHGNPFHLGASVIFFGLFGAFLEVKVGLRFLLALFLLAASAAGTTWLFGSSADAEPLLGASGAISALAICTLLMRFNVIVFGMLIAWYASQVFFAPVDGFSTIHWTIHLAGVAIGLAGFIVVWLFDLEEGEKVNGLDRADLSLAKAKAKTAANALLHNNGRVASNPSGQPAERIPETGKGDATKTEQTDNRKAVEEIEISAASSERSEERMKDSKTVSSGMDEDSLNKVISTEPKNLEARVQLLDLYIGQKRIDNAMEAGLKVIKMALHTGFDDQAFDTYRKLSANFRKPSINSEVRMKLIRNRLENSDWQSSAMLIEEMEIADPGYALLPELTARLVHLLVMKFGQQSEMSRGWINKLLLEYPSHPIVVKYKEELDLSVSGDPEGMRQAQVSETAPEVKANGGTVTASEVQNSLDGENWLKAAELLLVNNDLISLFDPVKLLKVCAKLSPDDGTVVKAVMLLELTVRLHIDHPNTPSMILELMELYLTRLEKTDRALQWMDFLVDRWPNSHAAREAKKLLGQ